jgi:hypothetical protein
MLAPNNNMSQYLSGISGNYFNNTLASFSTRALKTQKKSPILKCR